MSTPPPTPISLVQDYNDYETVHIEGDPETTFVTNGTGDLDTFFVLISGYLVFFMQCGFAMLSVGSVRSKNAKNIVLKNLLDACFGAIFFYMIGYGFAYGGEDGNKFIGWSGFALNGEAKTNWYSWFFQFAFAATAATIVSGAVAERCKFEGYICYAIVLTSWVYPVVVHWIWSETGWASSFRPVDSRLFGVGVVDFAGSGVVHMVGGLSALAGAAAIGPRVGRYDADGNANNIAGHNASLAILGVFILWFGWYGFNPGSALAIIGYGPTAALCAINTTLGAAAGTLAALLTILITNFISTHEALWDLIGASNGTLGGLVGITAACSVVEPWAAIIIGFTSGILYVFASKFIAGVLKVDDPLDAVAVHGCCGTWGVLMAGVFSHTPNYNLAYGPDLMDAEGEDRVKGWIYGGDGRMFAAQIVYILAIVAWVLGHMVPFFIAMRFAGLLRVDEAEERAGLDVSHHGGSAYEAPGATELTVGKEGTGFSHSGAGEDGTMAKSGKGGESEALLSRVQYLEQQVKAMRALPVEGRNAHV